VGGLQDQCPQGVECGRYLQYIFPTTLTLPCDAANDSLAVRLYRTLKPDRFKKGAIFFFTMSTIGLIIHSKFTGSRFHVCSFLFLSSDLIRFSITFIHICEEKREVSKPFPLLYYFFNYEDWNRTRPQKSFYTRAPYSLATLLLFRFHITIRKMT
jgi:hypothetical protein